MATSYMQILHDVGLRMNALVGTQAAALETTYATATLTSANFKSADFPFTSFRDSILMAEAELAAAIAIVPNHPWRAYLTSTTSALTSGATLPKLDSASHPIIGVYGGVYDPVLNTPLTEQPLEVIQRYIQGAWRVVPIFFYAMEGNRIYHTRGTATITCCIYDRVTQLAAFAAGNIVLPDVLEAALTARAISIMTRDNAYIEQAGIYRNYSDQAIAGIAKGVVTVPTLPRPAQLPASSAS